MVRRDSTLETYSFFMSMRESIWLAECTSAILQFTDVQSLLLSRHALSCLAMAALSVQALKKGTKNRKPAG
jgi:hypothetical protein